jgi:hypothetical protein
LGGVMGQLNWFIAKRRKLNRNGEWPIHFKECIRPWNPGV